MRRFWVTSLGLLALVGCGDTPESSIIDPVIEEAPPPDEPGTPLPGTPDLFDGNTGASLDNPFFYFLPPLISGSIYSGVAEEGLQPVVSVCPVAEWELEDEACSPGEEIARFSVNSKEAEDRIEETPGLGYRVTWNTSTYPALPGMVYRVSVSVIGKLIGYVDVLAFQGDTSCETDSRGQRECETRPYDPAQGHAAFYHRGSLDIAFRIEEGAIESEYCDPTNLEDCDVEVFNYETGGCLRVYENPGQSGEMLGSQACVPGGAAELDGVPVEGAFAVILTLEKDDTFQGSGDGTGQVPFFPDLRTDPPGISFDQDSEGVGIVICQAAEGPGSVPEDLHPSLRPFAIFADGSISLPDEYAYGAPECEGFSPHAHASAADFGQGGNRGFLGRVASGFSKVSKFFLPQPLRAFRLHGGLNTTVYNTKGDTDEGDEGDNAPRRGPGDRSEDQLFFVELGAVLAVDPAQSSLLVPAFGSPGAESILLFTALNAQGDPFPFELPVTVDISGANPETLTADYLGLGQYTVGYSPRAPGTDVVTVSVEGLTIEGSNSSTVLPVPASAEKTTFEVTPSQVGSATTVSISVFDLNGAPYVHGEEFPVDVKVSVTKSEDGSLIQTLSAQDDDGEGNFDGIFGASFVPGSFGSFQITVSVGGEATPDSPKALITDALPADPDQSYFVATQGVVGGITTVTVFVFNTAGGVYYYSDYRPVEIQVFVTGANVVTFLANDPDFDGSFTGTYTPTNPGTDNISVSIDGVDVPGTFTSEVDPLAGTVSVALDISGGAPMDGLPVQLYRVGASVPLAATVTGPTGLAQFSNITFADYVVHLPTRDFDVRFDAMSQNLTHGDPTSQVTFAGETQSVPAGSVVWRIKDGGTGNAYQYRKGSQGWASAKDVAETTELLGVEGHLASLTSFAENNVLVTLFRTSPDLCPANPGDCNILGWIGLSDQETEGRYAWVTGENLDFFKWLGGRSPVDPTGADDFVHIDAGGFWGTGGLPAPSGPQGEGPQRVVELPPAVEGYFVEWETERPSGQF